MTMLETQAGPPAVENTGEYVIRAANLSKSFEALQAVRSLDLNVSAGEIYGLVGPDGAGKTTAMRLLCGALQPDRIKDSQTGPPLDPHAAAEQDSPAAGLKPVHSKKNQTLIEINGVDLLAHPDQAREFIGYLPQRFSLYEDLTVLENLRFFAEIRGLSKLDWEPRCLETLRFVGLDSFLDRRTGQLSGGMKQKLGLAVALVHSPRLLLLDEPTTGVDPVTRQDFWQLIIKLVNESNAGQRNVAVLVSTPYMDEAARCTRLGFMRSGKLLLEGSPSTLCARLSGQIYELYGSPLRRLRQLLTGIEGIPDVRMFGDRLHLRIDPGSDAGLLEKINLALNNSDAVIHSLRQVPAKLEDVFVSLLQSAEELSIANEGPL